MRQVVENSGWQCQFEDCAVTSRVSRARIFVIAAPSGAQLEPPSTDSTNQDNQDMAPSEYSFRLQNGISGGFAPPTPSAIYTITRPLNHTTLAVGSAVRPDGTASLQDAAPKSLSVQEGDPLVEELHGILKTIPTESPPGSEDIYGLDTSIAWGSDDLQWCNGGPSGCGGGTSTIKASEEDKAKFRRAVEIVNELVGKAA